MVDPASLIMASSNGHKDIVDTLIAKGTDVNAKDNKGQTALMWASKNGKEDVVELLYQHGAE
jgi:ankyrin repeat protein